MPSKEVLMGWVRHGATALGPLLIAVGWVDATEWGQWTVFAEQAVGVVMLGWGLYASWKVKQV